MTANDTEAAAAAELGERLFGALVQTYDVFSVYLGDRLGLYAALQGLGASPAAEVAKAAGVDERYVREWLEHQATTGILRTDDAALAPGSRRYTFPAGYGEVLTNADSLSFLSPFIRLVIATIVKTPELLRAYRTGDGLDWAEMGEDVLRGQEAANKNASLQLLGQEWLPSLPEVHARLTNGGRVADIGCGAGWSSIGIAKAYPTARVDGFDLDATSIEWARENAAKEGVADRVTFHAQDAATVEGATGYDLAIAVEMVHDLAQPVEVLRTMRRLVEPSGTVLVVDENVAEAFAAPGGDVDRLMYGFSLATCLPNGRAAPVSAATGAVMRPATLRGYALQAGFRDVEIAPIESDLFRFYQLVG